MGGGSPRRGRGKVNQQKYSPQPETNYPEKGGREAR